MFQATQIRIIGSTGFSYYGIGTIKFKVNDRECEISTIRSPSHYLVLTEEAELLNSQLVTLLNCEGEPSEDDEFDEDAYIELMNDVLEEQREEFEDLLATVRASVMSFEELMDDLAGCF